MKALIASDSHGRQDRLFELMKTESFDAFFFCGDGEGLEYDLFTACGVPSVTAMVKGNNDYGSTLPSETVICFGGHKIFMTHGHRYRLFTGTGLLTSAARENECETCLFGHTHRPLYRYEDGILLLNPGSVTQPRQESGIPTFAVFETKPGGDVEVRFYSAETFEELT